MTDSKVALALFSHPDDAEFMCAGTLALLYEKGWDIHIATMTPGDCGTAEYTREEISEIRKNEARKSARKLKGTYHCLEFHDVFIMYEKQTIVKTLGLLRKVRPTIIFAPSPSDYMVDHEITSKIVGTACFSCGIKNIEIKDLEPFEPIPYLYYADAMEGKDKLGKAINPDILVDISSTIDIKGEMLSCHETQRNWLLTHHGIDEYFLSMKIFASKRGSEIDTSFAEGFRQHLGHGFHQKNILKNVLGDLVYEKKTDVW